MAVVKVDTSEMTEAASILRAGDEVLLSGVVYTARDEAHRRICAMLRRGEDPPFPLRGSTVYYSGPAPAPPGFPIGSCGPTTSARMDAFTPLLLDLGLKGMIGKGGRSRAVEEAIRRNGAVYLCAVGGAGALAARCVKKAEIIAFPELGCESIRKLRMEEFPLIVGIDSKGGSLFTTGD